MPTGLSRPATTKVLPIVWSDNDITLWPGESETLTATYSPSQLRATPVVSLYGWNDRRFDVSAARES
jgi:exo-1,4-beta-D-glucosaminidase